MTNNDKPKSKTKEQILKAFRETMSGSSIHSFPNISQNQLMPVKIMWFLFFLASTSVCFWLISKSINDYLDFAVITKIETIYETSLTFPIVTICNINPFSSSYASQLVINTTNELFNNTLEFISYDIKFLAQAYINMIENFDKTQLGYNLNQLVVECKFNYKECNLYDDFEYYYDINYGNCFRFNSGRNMKGSVIALKDVVQSGIYGALDLKLYVGAAIDNYNVFSEENGLIIFINNETVDSNYNEGTRVSAGFATTIMLSKNSINKLPRPYSQCIYNLTSIDSYESTCYKRTFSPNKTYHYTDCLKNCMQKVFGDYCHCQTTQYDVNYYPNMRKCLSTIEYNTNQSSQDIVCLKQTYFLFAKSSFYIEQCDCPMECDKIVYTQASSISEFPTQNYIEYLKTNPQILKHIPENLTYSDIKFENIKQRLASVKIFFNEMSQTKISEIPKTETFDLISQIGGTLGLFVGASFLSIVELFEIILQSLIIIYQNRSRKVVILN